MVFIKIHNMGDRELLAIADEHLIGESFEEGDACLFVDEFFYSGDSKEEGEVKAMLGRFRDFNVVGQGSVQILIDYGILDLEDVMYIGGVAHACITTA